MVNLASALAEMSDAGRAAWPGVEVTPEDHAAFVASRAGTLAEARALHAEDLYLACACAAGDALAIASFDRRFIADVPSFLRRVERSPAVLDEVSQALRDLLFVPRPPKPAKITEYSGRGALGSWLRVVALRTCFNLKRGDRHHEDVDEAAPAAAILASNPEIALLRERSKAAFQEALREAFTVLDPADRTLLRLHFLDGLSIDRLGVVLQAHRATAARRLTHARQTLLDRTLTLLRARLRLSPQELESLIGVVRSQLDVSLHALLKSG